MQEDKQREITQDQAFDLATRAGRILLESGAEIHRVQETMERIALHYGFPMTHHFVLSNGIFASGRNGYSNIDFIPFKGAQLDKVAVINQLSREIEHDSLTLADARRQIEEINLMPAKPLWEQLLYAALGCAGFCGIFGGSILDCVASAVIAVIAWAFTLYIAGKNISKPLTNILGSALCTTLCILFMNLGFGQNFGNMIVGTIILLIPGVAFTNGIRDLAGQDYLAGSARLLDAIMTFLCIAIGVSVTLMADSYIEGGVIQLTGQTYDPFILKMPCQLICAFVGTFAFAAIYGIERREYAASGIVGTLGWLGFYISYFRFECSSAEATFVATLTIAAASRLFAVWRKRPSTIYIISGMLPLVPGAGIYWTTYYLMCQQFSDGLMAGFNSIKVCIAITLGIIIVSEIPIRFFKMFRPR
ncbi:MAG: threonine/serine exporter family protein [Bacteroidaceae bacterium]|nr:threonine/serine exporter family protein [Bacteroidaceae bacterium]